MNSSIFWSKTLPRAGTRTFFVAPQLGIRSGRRIQGRARLADEDVLAARVARRNARGAWPMERWETARVRK